MNAQSGPLKARVEWDHDATEDLDAQYANQMFVSTTESEVTLLFGTALSPPFMERPPHDVVIKIKPQAKVVVSHQAMEKFREMIENVFGDDEKKDSD